MSIKHNSYYVINRTISAGSTVDINFPGEPVTIDIWNGDTALKIAFKTKESQELPYFVIPAGAAYSVDIYATGVKIINESTTDNNLQIVIWYEV